MIRDTVTIVGANGFLGRNMAAFFAEQGVNVISIYRTSDIDPTINYGTVFFCLGVCVDFQRKIFDTVDAHIMQLKSWLQLANFDQFVYLSSARIYSGQTTSDEDLAFYLIHKNDVYTQTKLLGEFACLSSEKPVLVLRLSNVLAYQEDSPYFLWDVFRQVWKNKTVHIQETKDSMREYLCLEDFLEVVYKISQLSLRGIFNVSSGVSITHGVLQNLIDDVFHCNWNYGSKKFEHSQISNLKISRVLGQTFIDPEAKIRILFTKFIKGRR